MTVSTMSVPDEAEQQKFWNEWNSKYRGVEKVAHLDTPTLRRRDVVLGWLRQLQIKDANILDLGCATGWLTSQLAQFGTVTGVDIADASIREARSLYPHIEFACGDFVKMRLKDESFDAVVSLDTLSHVADQVAFVQRARRVLKPGGFLMLTIQNRFVFERRADVDPQGAGQIRHWLTRAEMRTLLESDFVIVQLTTLVPEGHLGILRLVNSHKLNGALRRLGFMRTWEALREWLGFGQTLAVLAQRR